MPVNIQSPHILKKPLIVLVGLAAVLLVVPTAVGSLVYPLLAVHALRGQRQTVEAFTVLFFVLLANPILAAAGGGTFRWLVLLAGFARLIWDAIFSVRSIHLPGTAVGVLGIFFVWAAVGAGLSNVPSLSILKLLSFAVGVITILGCFATTVHLASYWRSWFHTYFFFLMCASIAIFPLGVGYLRTYQGFQGIFSHPQILGPMAAIGAAWFTGTFLSTGRRSRWHVSFGLVASWGLVFLSGARTGAFAVGGGLMLTMGLLAYARTSSVSWRVFRRPSVWGTVMIFSTGLLVAGPTIQANITSFLFKDDLAKGSAEELFEASRGKLTARSMENFYSAPVAGIGFGIPSDLGSLEQRTESVMGIPVSASYEKGFMPSAMLEEVGVVGTGLIVLFLAFVTSSIVRWGGLVIAWTFWASILVNVGEAVFFSIGGLGFFVWLMIGFCYAQAQATKRAFCRGRPRID